MSTFGFCGSLGVSMSKAARACPVELAAGVAAAVWVAPVVSGCTGTAGTVTVGMGVSALGLGAAPEGAVVGGEDACGALAEAAGEGGGVAGLAGAAPPPLTRSAILFWPAALFGASMTTGSLLELSLIDKSDGFSRHRKAKAALATTTAANRTIESQSHGRRDRG
jgi:hypothetical protein